MPPKRAYAGFSETLNKWRTVSQHEFTALVARQTAQLEGMIDAVVNQPEITVVEFSTLLPVLVKMGSPQGITYDSIFVMKGGFDPGVLKQMLQGVFPASPKLRKRILDVCWTLVRNEVPPLQRLINLYTEVPVLIEFNPLMHISDLSLRRKTFNSLLNAEIKFLGQLVSMSERQLLMIRNFGRMSFEEVRNKLESMDLELGFDFPNKKEFLEKYPLP